LKKKKGESKGRKRARLDPKAGEAVNVKYVVQSKRNFRLPPDDDSDDGDDKDEGTKKKEKKGFLFYVTGLKPIWVDNGPSFLSRNAFCKWRLKWTYRRINFLRKPQCV
jgi:hypothetical protein